MRALIVLVVVCAAALAQPAQQGAIMRGVFLELDPDVGSSQFSLRAPDNQVFRYRFDSTTYVERDSKVTVFAALKPGDRIEVVSDADPHGAIRYALMVKILADPVPARPTILGRTVSVSAPPVSAPPVSVPPERTAFGSSTFSGVLIGISETRITLRLKDGRERRVLLRKDTRCLEDSRVVSPEELRANMRVTVTGSWNALGGFEADQIVWGQILRP